MDGVYELNPFFFKCFLRSLSRPAHDNIALFSILFCLATPHLSQDWIRSLHVHGRAYLLSV
jgi:hypothetical protein